MSFHLFHIRELYSNADGSVQFIEFVGDADGEIFWAGHSLISTNGSVSREFVFPTNLPSASTLGRSVLVATQSFAAMGLVKPDFIVPDGFLFTAGGTVGVPGMDQVSHGALPGGGTQSVNQNGVVGTASPTNFAGAGATIPGNPIVGTLGADNLDGSSGNDYIVARGGNDTLNGAAGNDTMFGGAGNDTYIVANSGDRVYETTTVGGSINAGGTDTVRSSVTHTLGSFVEHLVLTGTGAISGTGNALANSLLGNGAANLLRGANGNDVLVGGAGADTLHGDAHNDLLRGGAGNDILHGGAGNDLFRFDTALSSATVQNVDQIKDFDPAADTIQLENSIFTRFGTSTTGPINPAFFRANTTGLAQDSNDYVVYETDTGRLFYDFNGSASGASVQIAVLGVNLALSSADFVLV